MSTHTEVFLRTKEDIINKTGKLYNTITEYVASVLLLGSRKNDKKVEFDHSARYWLNLARTIRIFENEVKLRRIMSLSDNWYYEIDITYEGISLQLREYEDLELNIGESGDDNIVEYPLHLPIEKYVLFTSKLPDLTIEEFAAECNVEEVTVRQWIRRGKIKTAQKIGNEWRIPALSDVAAMIPSSDGDDLVTIYDWDGPLAGLPEEYSYLNNYKRVTIYKLKKDNGKAKKTVYYKFVYRPIDDHLPPMEYINHMEEIDVKEKEKRELFLISHPQIRYTEPDTTAISSLFDEENEDDSKN